MTPSSCCSSNKSLPVFFSFSQLRWCGNSVPFTSPTQSSMWWSLPSASLASWTSVRTIRLSSSKQVSTHTHTQSHTHIHTLASSMKSTYKTVRSLQQGTQPAPCSWLCKHVAVTQTAAVIWTVYYSLKWELTSQSKKKITCEHCDLKRCMTVLLLKNGRPCFHHAGRHTVKCLSMEVAEASVWSISHVRNSWKRWKVSSEQQNNKSVKTRDWWLSVAAKIFFFRFLRWH